MYSSFDRAVVTKTCWRKGILYWLCLNKLPLPPTLTTLALIQDSRVLWPEQDYITCVTHREQSQILERLSAHLPNLKNVTLGGFHVQWEIGDDGRWKPARRYSFYIDNKGQPPESWEQQ